MAKKSLIARERKRARLVARYAEKRVKLKKEGNYAALDKLPKNACPIRLHNRCQVTGRPRGYLRYFKMSRVSFRKLASEGKIPGVVKASW